MYNQLDLTGKRFGRLVAQEYVKGSRWICKCDCGNIVTVMTNKLISGNTKSCKCYRNTLLAKERTLGKGYASFKEVLRHYIRTSTKRGHKFNLSESICYEIMQKDCIYCGTSPSQIYKHRDCFGEFIYNGMDRIDSSKGYFEGNVVPCCKTCNYAKRIMSLSEFKEWIERVYKRRKDWSIG